MPAWGQQATGVAAADGGLEDIIVTAQKRSESLNDIPLAITAQTSAMLEARGITDTEKLQYVTPGLQVNTTGASPAFFLRGIGTRLTAAGLEGSIAIYLDDRYVSRSNVAIFSHPDIERIEVLKGPQGTLYGRNATGGAIRVITNDVANDDEGYVSASYGNFNYLKFAAVANVVVSDNFGVRIFGQSERRNGIAKNIAPGNIPPKDLNDLNNQLVGFKAKWDMTDTMTFRFGGTYVSKDETPGYATVDASPVLDINGVPTTTSTALRRGGVTGTSPRTVSTALQQTSKGDEFTLNAQLDIDLGGVTIKSATSYNQYDYIFALDSDGTNLRITDVTVPETNKAFSQELQVASSNDSSLTWVVGGFGWYDKASYNVNVDAGLNRPDGSIRYLTTGDQTVGTTALALFAQATYAFNDHFELTLGARQSYEKKKVTLRNPIDDPNDFPDADIMLTPGVSPGSPYRDSVSFNNFTPKATLTYRINGDNMVYATFSKGFKSGGYNVPAIGQAVLQPEKLTMYELGAKGALLNNKLHFDISGYYYDFKDLQVSRSSGQQSIVENAANARVKGIDFNADWRITRAFTLSGGVAWLDGQYKNYLAAPRWLRRDANGDGVADFDPVTRQPVGTPMGGFSIAPFNADGADLIRAPKWSAYVTGQYVLDVGKGTMPISLTYSYKSSFVFDIIPEKDLNVLKQPAYGLLNGRIAYVSEDSKWTFAIWANNIANKSYFLDKSAGDGAIRAIYGNPRTFGADAKFTF